MDELEALRCMHGRPLDDDECAACDFASSLITCPDCGAEYVSWLHYVGCEKV